MLKILSVIFLISQIGAAPEGVPGPAKISFSPSPVIKYDKVTFTCTADLKNAADDYHYVWYKDGKLLNTTESTYTIEEVTLEDKGSYSCKLVRADVESEKATIFMDVFNPPDCTIQKLERNGKPTLACLLENPAEGNHQELAFYWLPTESYNGIPKPENDIGKGSYLEIPFNVNDVKKYTCVANSTHGYGMPCRIEIEPALD